MGFNSAFKGLNDKHNSPKRQKRYPEIGDLITVIPRLTKIIRSGITFVSRNVFISAPGMARPFMFAALC